MLGYGVFSHGNMQQSSKLEESIKDIMLFQDSLIFFPLALYIKTLDCESYEAL